MKNLTVILNEIKYLKVEILMDDQTSRKKLIDKVKKHKGIYVGIKKVKYDSFLRITSCIVKVLIPETNIIDFDADETETQS